MKKINKSKIVKRSILMNVQNIVLMMPIRKRQKIGKCEKVILMNIRNNCFGKTPLYLKGYNFYILILSALLSNKNGILHYLKSQ